MVANTETFEPLSARRCPNHPFLEASIVLVDDEQIPPKPLVSPAKIEEWLKQEKERKEEQRKQERREAEVRFREDVRAAFFDANPQVTEQDFNRMYAALRDLAIQEQTRLLLEQRERQRLDLTNPRLALRGAYRDLFLGKRASQKSLQK
jgi:hypothetical protein